MSIFSSVVTAAKKATNAVKGIFQSAPAPQQVQMPMARIATSGVTPSAPKIPAPITQALPKQPAASTVLSTISQPPKIDTSRLTVPTSTPLAPTMSVSADPYRGQAATIERDPFAEKASSFITTSGPAQRAKAVIQSVQERSLTPLKESFKTQAKTIYDTDLQKQAHDIQYKKLQAKQSGGDYTYSPEEKEIIKSASAQINTLVGGIGGGVEAFSAKKIIETITKSKAPSVIARELETLGVEKSLIPELSARFSKVNNFEEVAKGLDTLLPGQGFGKTIGTQRIPGSPLESQGPRSGSPQLAGSGGGSSLEATVPKDSPFYNVDRLNVSPEAKAALKAEIEKTAAQTREVVGTTLSNKEVIDLANNSSKVLHKTVTRQQTAEAIAANLKLRQQIANAVKTGTIENPDDFFKLWIQDKSVGEDIARQLQARRIGADPKEASVIDTLLESIYKVNKNADEIAAAAKGVDFNDPEQVAAFYRKFVKPKAEDWLDALRYNSMLSSPNTHIINIASNFEGTGLIAPLEKTITGTIDAVRSAITGSPRQAFAGEGAVYLKNYAANVGKAFKNFSDVMRGNRVSMMQELHNIPLTKRGTVARAGENILKLPGRLLQSMDEFFNTMAEAGAKSGLEYRASKGVNVPNIETMAALESRKRLFNADLGISGEGPLLKALDFIPNKVLEARNSSNPIVRTIAKFSLPFVKIPANLFKQGIEYSPFGLATIPGAANKTEQISKAIIGMSSAVGAATLLGADRLSWAEPTDAKQKAAFRASGRQAYAIKIGDKWVSYSKLHPAMSFNLALISAIDDAQKNKKLREGDADAILNAFAKYGNFIADQSYLRSIGDFLATTKGDVEGATRYFSNYAQQLIPFRAMMGWITRLTDPVQRQADPDGSILERQMQQIMSQIPGLSEKVPARKGPDGKPIPQQNPWLNAFSPNRITTEDAQQREHYQRYQELRKKNSEETQKSDTLRQEAMTMYETLKNDPEAEQKFEQLITENPALAKKITEVAEDVAYQRNDVESALYNLGVENGGRAQQIYQDLLAMPESEKADYYQNLIDKKIITAQVAKQLATLLGQP